MTISEGLNRWLPGLVAGVGLGVGFLTAYQPSLVYLIGAAVALIGLLRYSIQPYFVVLLFAGRFRGFPYASALPEWLHGTHLALYAILLFLGIQGAMSRKTPEGLSREGQDTYKLSVIILGVFCLWVLSSYWTGLSHSTYAFGKTVDLIVLNSAMFLLVPVIVRTEHDLKVLLGLIIAFGAIFLFVAFFDYAGTRLSAFGGGPNVFVRYMGLAAIATFCFYTESSGRLRSLMLVLSALFCVGAILSGSRGGTISLGVVLFVYALYLARAHRKRLVALSIIIPFAISGLVFAQSSLIATRLLRLFSTSQDTAIMARQDYYEAAFEMFKLNPLAGHGPGSFVAFFGGGRYPHNVELELLAEFGLIGFGLFLLWMFAAGRPSAIQTPYRSMGLAVLGFSILVSQFSGDLFDSRVIWFSVGLLVAIRKIADARSTKTQDVSLLSP